MSSNTTATTVDTIYRSFDELGTETTITIVLSIIFPIIATILISLRLFARIRLVRNATGVDDILIVAALLLSYVFSTSCLISGFRYARPGHVFSTIDRVNLMKVLWIEVGAGASSIALIRISVLLFYRRLTHEFSRKFLIACWIGIIYTVLSTTAIMILAMLVCTPLEGNWMRNDPSWLQTHPEFKCSNIRLDGALASIVSLVGDIYTAILPVFLLRYIRTRPLEKVLLSALFSLGFVVVGVAVMRAYAVITETPADGSGDLAWIWWDVTVWFVVEIYLAMFCACGPALKIYVSLIRRKWCMLHDTAADTADESIMPTYGTRKTVTFSVTEVTMSDPKGEEVQELQAARDQEWAFDHTRGFDYDAPPAMGGAYSCYGFRATRLPSIRE